MSSIFKRVSAMAGTLQNEQHNSCHSPFLLSREAVPARPVIGAPAFYARNFARPALQSIALFLLIVISMIAMVRPAGASGVVTAQTTLTYTCRNGAICTAAQTMQSYCDYYTGVGSAVRHDSTGNAADYYRLYFSCWQPLWNPPAWLAYPSHPNLVSIVACPDHSQPTGTTICTCTDPYVPDPTKTRCVLELFTISLHDLGGEVMPNQTRDAFAAVTKSDGTAGVGVQVDLFLDVVPELEGQLPFAYKGTVTPDSGRTDWEGKLHFVFKAPGAGGTHTITATCSSCAKEATGKIRVPGCSVPPLTEVKDIPPNGPDVLPLTLRLEETKGSDLALLPDAQAGVNCVKAKEPSAVISSGTRTVAYQAHLKEIWDKSKQLNKAINLKNTACQPLRDKVEAEKGCNGGHCIVHPPATDSKHTMGKAFDVSRDTIYGLLQRLRPPPPPLNSPQTLSQQHQADIKLIADWLVSPAACNLTWGGNFDDPVHFQIP